MDARTRLLIAGATANRIARNTPRHAQRNARRVVRMQRPAPTHPDGIACPFAGTPETSCCEPCEDQGLCREDANCCLECHFSYEEQLAFQYIPEEGRQILRQQHAWLIANGFPHEELEAHSQYEMLWFRPYCPPEIVAQIDKDHAEYGEGHLRSRDAIIIEPEPALAPISIAGRWVNPLSRR